MNYLAVDTASKILKVLVCFNGKYEYFQCADFKAASVGLMPAIDSLLKKSGATLADMDFFACVTGPGSFTGIRIGMATIKAFAYVTSGPVVPVTALELLAYNNSGEETALAVADASNGMRYVAVYDDKTREIMPPRCLSSAELAEFLSTIDEPFGIYTESALAEELPTAKVPENFEKAFALAVENNADRAVNGNIAEPLYIRKPQAERDLEANNAASRD